MPPIPPGPAAFPCDSLIADGRITRAAPNRDCSASRIWGRRHQDADDKEHESPTTAQRSGHDWHPTSTRRAHAVTARPRREHSLQAEELDQAGTGAIKSNREPLERQRRAPGLERGPAQGRRDSLPVGSGQAP
ncbi:hypothetical protein GCM10022222_65080 [Amycolatopsis ultiminotia]|uniref:Uncharacterized protein n=1 Tax=Amycolatopsis ultiminotia TaxID=543629 RepID=A0ABP6XSG5_9PSEU